MLISQQRITPKISDLFSIFVKKNSQEERKILQEYFLLRNLYWTGSGREALRQILLNIDKQRVGLPAYTCHVVLEAVQRAKKIPVFYDSGVVAEIEEIKKIIKSIDVLIVCYNFGFLPDIEAIAKLCQEHGVILIEDCAQALGAMYQTSRGQQLAGSFGDYAFYSFGISKNIGFCGGLISSSAKMNLMNKKKFPFLKLLKVILEVIISPLFFNKYVYPYTSTLLGTELNKKQDALDYSLPHPAKKIILHQLKRYDLILRKRRLNGEYCLKTIEKMNPTTLETITPLTKTDPAWLYFPLLVKNKEEFKKKLLTKGVEIDEMRTFVSLDQKGKKSLQAEKHVLAFALFREDKEIKLIIKAICEVTTPLVERIY